MLADLPTLVTAIAQGSGSGGSQIPAVAEGHLLAATAHLRAAAPANTRSAIPQTPPAAAGRSLRGRLGGCCGGSQVAEAPAQPTVPDSAALPDGPSIWRAMLGLMVQFSRQVAESAAAGRLQVPLSAAAALSDLPELIADVARSRATTSTVGMSLVDQAHVVAASQHVASAAERNRADRRRADHRQPLSQRRGPWRRRCRGAWRSTAVCMGLGRRCT